MMMYRVIGDDVATMENGGNGNCCELLNHTWGARPDDMHLSLEDPE